MERQNLKYELYLYFADYYSDAYRHAYPVFGCQRQLGTVGDKTPVAFHGGFGTDVRFGSYRCRKIL